MTGFRKKASFFFLAADRAEKPGNDTDCHEYRRDCGEACGHERTEKTRKAAKRGDCYDPTEVSLHSRDATTG